MEDGSTAAPVYLPEWYYPHYPNYTDNNYNIMYWYTCPYCNQSLSSWYKFCPYCGKQLWLDKNEDVESKLDKIIELLKEIRDWGDIDDAA